MKSPFSSLDLGFAIVKALGRTSQAYGAMNDPTLPQFMQTFAAYLEAEIVKATK